ncbi:VWA domain-containing protein [Wenzhouxiangellaceae bacterium CH-27]|uniref:VWA domain-containing protein n=1 Tax=Elongatibacter sediminis TaxID=3119006 RepID=A0AAW9RCI7_9GAMM
MQFSHALRQAGLPVSPANLVDLCDCLRFVDIRDRRDFHAAARATLVSDQDGLGVFESVFDAFWNSSEDTEPKPRKRDPKNRDDAPGRRTQTAVSQLHVLADDERGSKNKPGNTPLSWSQSGALTRKDFKHMTDEELETAQRLLARMVALLPRAPSRRQAPGANRGSLDLRRMLRANALSGTDGLELRYRRPRPQHPRLLLLCDVSGSMERYSRFLINFIYGLRRQITRTHVAVFATRMTEITDVLNQSDIAQALQEVGDQVRDWGGGTDIGRCLQAFNDRFEDRMHHAHTTVIILSDGWDRGDAGRMRDEIQRLNSAVQRLIWLNPLLSHDAYQPLCQGMRTAMPFIDDFLPAHNLESLEALLRQLRSGTPALAVH